MKKILFFAVILLLSLSFLIFHDKGNEILKPYVSGYLKDKVKKNISIELQDLKIDLNYVKFSALLNNVITINAEGNLSLFFQELHLDYTLKSDNFKHKIDINGTITGTFNDMKIQGEGEGETVKSHINYALNLKDDVIEKIKLKINKADIASFLQVLSQPAYAEGKVDIDIDIPTLTKLNNKGKVNIILNPSTLNEKVFKEKFKIDLPKEMIVTANIHSKVHAKAFELEGDISSNLATLKFFNTTYSINTKELLANYVLSIPRLSKVLFLTKKKLNAKLKIDGKVKLKKKKINLIGTSKSLGGKTHFNYNGKSLNTFMENIEITKLLYLLNEKPYATGKLNANLKLNDLEQLAGTFELKTKNAKTINHTLRKEFDLNFKKPIPFTLNSTGDIDLNVVNTQSIVQSNILTYTSNNLKYNLTTSTLSSSYQLDIPKLSKFNTLVGKSLKGKLIIDGEMNYDNDLIITGSTKSLDGSINFRLSDKKLNSKINNVPVEKLMDILSYPQVFKASLLGNFNYDFATHKGKFTSTLNQAKLLSSDLTVSIMQLRGLDLTKERYNETHFNATFTKNLIDIDFEAKNKKVLLSIPFGRINKANNNIDATFNIKVDNKDIAGKIQGDISDPKIIINSSKFIKDEMQNMMQGNMPDQAFKELGFGKKETDMMRNMMDSFF
jgi:hypothetical protein